MAVMEIARLRVRPENAAALAAARGPFVEAFTQRPGFVRSELVRVADDEWLDLIIWATSEDFAESRRRGGDSEPVQAFFALIDGLVSSEEGQVWAGQ
jgi:heme-degrading monooxygenase HmoA